MGEMYPSEPAVEGYVWLPARRPAATAPKPRCHFGLARPHDSADTLGARILVAWPVMGPLGQTPWRGEKAAEQNQHESHVPIATDS